MTSFVNTFLSYLVVLLVICAVAAVAVTIGLTLAKKKNAKASVTEAAESAEKA